MTLKNRIILTVVEYGSIILILSGCAYAIYAMPDAAGSSGGFFMNADMVVLPTLFTDVTENLANFLGWKFSEAVFYFPDIVIFFAINFLVKQPTLSIALYGIVQFLLFFLATRWLFHELGGKQGWVYTLIFATGSLLATASYTFLMRNAGAFNIGGYIFLLGYIHFGAYLVSLACLASCLRYLRTGQISFLILSLIFVTLATLSDLIFVLYFALPFLIISVVLKRLRLFERSRVLALSIAVGVSGLAAYLLSRNKHINVFSSITGKFGFDLVELFSSMAQFFSDIFEQASPAIYCFILLFVIFPFLYILLSATLPLLSLVQRRKQGKNDKCAITSSKFAIFSTNRHSTAENSLPYLRWVCTKLFVALSALLPLIAMCATDRYASIAEIRYSTPLIYSAVFLLLSLSLAVEQTLAQYPQASRVGIAGIMGVALVILVSLLGSKSPEQQLFASPSYLACFRNLGNIAGLAGYWQSKPLILFSKRQLQIATITEKGEPYHWLNNRYWYIDNWVNPSQPPDFKFIFMRSLNSSIIKQQYGIPDRIIPCDGSEIWFYNRPGFLYQKLMQEHFEPFERAITWRHQVSIPAALFSNQIGVLQGLERVAKEKRDSAGFLIADSPLKLPRGRYKVSIDYQSSSSSLATSNGRVEVVFPDANKVLTQLSSYFLPMTQGNQQRVSLEFAVERRSNIFLRVEYQGWGELSVNSFRLQKITR